MEADQNDMTPHDAARALRWLAEMGADEIIGEEPVNRNYSFRLLKPRLGLLQLPGTAKKNLTVGKTESSCRDSPLLRPPHQSGTPGPVVPARHTGYALGVGPAG